MRGPSNLDNIVFYKLGEFVVEEREVQGEWLGRGVIEAF